MAVARYDAAALQSVPEIFGDVLVAEIGADHFLHLCEPVEHFLVSKTVERTR